MEPEDLILIPLLIVDGKAVPLIPVCHPNGIIRTFQRTSDLETYAQNNDIEHYDIAAVLHPDEY